MAAVWSTRFIKISWKQINTTIIETSIIIGIDVHEYKFVSNTIGTGTYLIFINVL